MDNKFIRVDEVAQEAFRIKALRLQAHQETE